MNFLFFFLNIFFINGIGVYFFYNLNGRRYGMSGKFCDRDSAEGLSPEFTEFKEINLFAATWNLGINFKKIKQKFRQKN